MRTLATLILTAAMVSACATDPGPRPPAALRLQPTGPSPWTQDFGDPVLAGLLAHADLGALDIKAALARLERADAEVRAAQAGRIPVVTLGADTGVGSERRQSKLRTGSTPSLAAAYEVDLFHRLASAVDATRAERRASEADLRAARLLIGAETTRAYLALRAAQLGEQQAARRQDLAQTALALIHKRHDEGRASAEDLEIRRRAVAEAAGQLTAARLEQTRQQLRLQALTGGPVSVPAGGLPKAPPLAAVPADLVAQRPDVIAAYARMQAADAQRASAVAASRPSFQIGLSLGAVDPEVLNLLDARALTWAAAASLSHDIFDGGRKAAAIRIASSDADLADIAYRKASLQGWSELQTALAEAAAADEDAARADAALNGAAKLLQVGQARRSEGALDGIGLAALQDQAAEAQVAANRARAQALQSRVALALASGGR